MNDSGVIAIDNGGHSTCIMTAQVKEMFPSVKGLYGKRTLTDAVGKYDFIVDYKSEKYVMGTLALHDCQYKLQMHTNSKQNIFFDLSILVAIHQFGFSKNYVVTTVPILFFNDTEKFGIVERLVGDHTITVNGVKKEFTIMNVKLTPESAVAFWISEPVGKNRFIDLGSRMIGYATTLYQNFNGEEVVRFIDTESGVFMGKGLEALMLNNSYDQKALADYICGRLISIWNPQDNVYLLGGGSLDQQLVTHISQYFPNSVVMENPQMANAIGMYQLGCQAYGME
jgi:plasmid segregation protein ParM